MTAPLDKLNKTAQRLLSTKKALSEWVSANPALAVLIGLALFIVTLLSNVFGLIKFVWELVSDKPLVPELSKYLPAIGLPDPPFQWIATAVGLVLLVLLVYLAWSGKRLSAQIQREAMRQRITMGAVDDIIPRAQPSSRRWLVPLTLSFLLVLAIIQTIWNIRNRKLLSSRVIHGVIIPANNDMLSLGPCEGEQLNEDDVVLILGDNVAITNGYSIPLVLRREQVFKIEREAAGVAISARIMSPDKKVIAQITKNELFANPSDRFYTERPNWHTLIVRDESGREILYVFYHNPKVIVVRGVFHTSSGILLSITSSGIGIDERSMFISQACLHGSGSFIGID